MDCFTSLVIYLHTSGNFGEPWSMLGVSQSMQIIFTAPNVLLWLLEKVLQQFR
jgi:hypothetical protein